MQNVAIAYLVIMLNFPSPQSDYALLPLIAISTITTVPLWILLFIKTCVYNIRKVVSEHRKGLRKEIDATNFEQTQKLNVAQENTPV